MNNTESAKENNSTDATVEENSSTQLQHVETSDMPDKEGSVPSWPVAIACAIFVSLPAAIPLYFAVTVSDIAARIIFICVGFMVLIVNILVVFYVLRKIGPGSR